MTLYKISKSFDGDDRIFYQVLPYSLNTIRIYFSKNYSFGDNGKYNFIFRLKSFFSFLIDCSLVESIARKKALRKNERI